MFVTFVFLLNFESIIAKVQADTHLYSAANIFIRLPFYTCQLVIPIQRDIMLSISLVSLVCSSGCFFIYLLKFCDCDNWLVWICKSHYCYSRCKNATSIKLVVMKCFCPKRFREHDQTCTQNPTHSCEWNSLLEGIGS